MLCHPAGNRWNECATLPLRHMTHRVGRAGARGRMGKRAEEYRERASECEALAAVTADAKFKSTYEDLAKRWRDLARQVDTLERPVPKP
jgi:hypothetical protein